MEWLTTLMTQLRQLWSRWNAAQRATIAGATAICVLAVAGTLYWATRPDYVVIASQLTPQRAAEIVGLLETEQIDVQMNFAGSAVSVSRSDVSRARLALKDIWETDTATTHTMSAAFPGSPSQEADRRRRNQEQRIANSILQIRGVRAATVHISQPDPSPFAVDQMPTTASVIIDPAPNGLFTATTAQSIVAMVAQAVEGLAPDRVTLVDTAGRQFGQSTGMSSTMDSQLEYQQRVEAHLAGKAETMLARMLGPGRAAVRVSAEVDFRKTTTTEQRYDPDAKVKRTEVVSTTSQTGGVSPTPGAAGAAANLVPNILETGNPQGTYKEEQISTDYDNGYTTQEIEDNPGRITRITVAAIVDLTPVAEPGADPAAAPPQPTATQAQVEQIIRRAVGFDDGRNDEIEVVIAPLRPFDAPETAPGPVAWWTTWGPIAQWAILALSASAMVVVGLLILRRLKPIQVAPSTDTQLSIEEVKRLMSLTEQARDNPELVATILNAWLEPSDPPESASTERPPETRRRAA